MSSPAVTPNPYAEFQQPVKGPNPYADFQQSSATQDKPGLLYTMKANFNAGTQHEPVPAGIMGSFSPKHLLNEFGASAGDAIRGAYHVFDTYHGPDPEAGLTGEQKLQNTANQIEAQGEQQVHRFMSDPGGTIAGHVGGAAPGMILGGALAEGASAIPKMATAAREAAIGDTDAAALRGLRVPPSGKKVLPMQSSVQIARPYLQGAKSLEDFQNRIPAAKNESFAPYKQTLDAVGDNPVKGPDGMTTIRALEDERQELSAMNRGLRTGDPSALRLAEQKGLSQADSLARENAIKAHLDPELSRYGIDPQAIRKTYGAISRLGNQVEGRSTLMEAPQPSGFGKIGNISLKQPLQAPGQILSGIRDIAAGRPLFRMSPADVGIREGFANAGPKPNLGAYTPFEPKALLGKPPIEMGAPPEVGGVPEGYRPPPVDATTTAMRLGRLLHAPPIELGGEVEGPKGPAFRYDTTPMRKGRILPAGAYHDIPLSSHADIFPDQIPQATRIKPKTIEGKK